MAVREMLRNAIAEWGRVIHEGGGEQTGPWVELAWFVAGARQFDKRMVLAHGDGVGRGSDLAHERVRILAGEGEDAFNFGVFRKVFRVGQVESAARRIQPERRRGGGRRTGSLRRSSADRLGVLDGLRNVVGVAQV